VSDFRPYSGRELSRKQKREIRKRVQRRADSMARAMPPPEKSHRVDPLTGRPLYGDSTTTQHQVPAFPTGPVSAPEWATHTPTPAQMPAAPSTRQSRSAKRKQNAPAPLPSLDRAFAQAQAPSVIDRLLAPAGPQTAQLTYIGGVTLAVLGLMLGVSLGLPVLGRDWDFAFAGVGTLALLFGGYWAYTGWVHTPAKARFITSVIGGLLAAAFCVGVASEPVVIDGKVLLSTSKEAKSVRLADDVYTDLRRAAELDDLLAAPIADARANVSRYKPAVKELTTMSTKYAGLSKGDLPDPSFGPVIESMKTSAYWASKAMETKAALIEQENARGEADLETQRATFTDNWFTTAKTLKQVTDALGVPMSTEMEGPHE
jgi:hypothetical protein